MPCSGPIEPVGVFEGVATDGDQRVDDRALLVEGRDAVQIHLHDLAAGKRAGFVAGVNVVNGCFNDIE